MLLTIDIGNTNLTLGLFDADKQLYAHWRLATDHKKMPDEYGLQLLGLLQNCGVSKDQLTGVVLGSVVPPVTGRIAQASQQYLGNKALIVTNAMCPGINILYDPPTAVGVDRLINVVAVKEYYRFPACVVDFGTGTTFDAVDRECNYLGGAITPGIGIAAEALFERASKLLKVDLEIPPSAIGRNTEHAVQSGLMYGYISLVEGMVARFREQLGEDMLVVATGGLAELIAQGTEVIDIVDPWLTLQGLRLIWEKENES
ncbi:MAG: type III pantothenate kinase [Anaerolineae bacterium]|jgi:type III pantothenate kinase|nr:type III pantothenate kinase [Anaerolineae bacterium]